MQKEVQKTTERSVESLYLTYTNSGELNSSVKVGQRRQNFKSTDNSYAKTLLAPSSSTFLTGATCKRL